MLSFNNIKFPDIQGLTYINQLMDNSKFKYLALIQYEDIIDYYLLTDINQSILNQLAYYLFIAYDIRAFNTDNLKVFNLDNTIIDQSYIDIMNSHISLLSYNDIINSSLDY